MLNAVKFAFDQIDTSSGNTELLIGAYRRRLRRSRLYSYVLSDSVIFLDVFQLDTLSFTYHTVP